MENSKARFRELFGKDPDRIYFSPGRVNLIGEHIDYNGGHVLPFAVSLGITGLVSFNEGKEIQVASSDFKDEIIRFTTDDLRKTDDFSMYIKGVLYILKEDYNVKPDNGFSLYLTSNLPKSSGLSSSASLEMLISRIMNDNLSLGLSDTELAVISKNAENRYVGVNCGIMDQFAVAMGKQDNCILLDTNTLKYEYVPLYTPGARLVIINTNKPRNLIESKYNERRMECDEALKLLKGETLCRNDVEDISELVETLKKRARHAITEEIRVNDACAALKERDMEKLGKLLKESHRSLRYDYEVTGKELDVIADALNSSSLCYGARMTGAGFGGCLVALMKAVDDSALKLLMEDVNAVYNKETGLNLSYYTLTPADGTRRII